MNKLIIIPNAEITKDQLAEVIRIKNVAWNYSSEKHLDWISKNIEENDLHVILSIDGVNQAYLNLVNITFEINEQEHQGLGIGNVCSFEKGKGFGSILMKETSKFLRKNNKFGLLFCKESLVEFYKKMGWKIIEDRFFSEPTRLILDNNIRAMISIEKEDIFQFDFKERLF